MRPKSRQLQTSGDMPWHLTLSIALLILGGLTLTLRGVDIFGLVAAATSSLSRSPVTLYLAPYDGQSLKVGESKKIDVAINAKVPINVIGTTITFPQDTLEVLGFSKEKSFLDLWTEETAINENKGEVHFSGGTTMPGGLTGTGTILTLMVRAKKSGDAQLQFKSAEVFPNDGTGKTIDTDVRTLSFTISAPAESAPVSDASAPTLTVLQKPTPPNPDVNDDGKINLLDVSIMVVRLMQPYDPRFDLNMDGAINIGDLSVVMANVR